MSEHRLDADLLSENAANVRAAGSHLVAISDDLEVAAKELASSQEENQRLRLYKRAMESMAAQFVCPKITAEELAKRQLEEVSDE